MAVQGKVHSWRLRYVYKEVIRLLAGCAMWQRTGAARETGARLGAMLFGLRFYSLCSREPSKDFEE